MLMNLRDMYDFCKAMMEAAAASGNEAAIALWGERAHDAYMVYGYEAGFFGE
jgi:hypothetical protein